MLAAQPINDNQFSVIGSVLMLMALPQAYRGYVFSFVGDEFCYYLGSRFYSPRLGRFLNADKHFDTETGVLGTNMFAYCNNNPVMFVDPTGESGLNIIAKLVSAVTQITTRLFQNSRAIQLLKDMKLYPYVRLTVNPTRTIYFSCVINKRITTSNNSFQLSLTGSIPKNIKVVASFEEQTVQYWLNYINSSIDTILRLELPGYEYLRDFRAENDIAFSVLSDIATGTLADVLFYWDLIELLFDGLLRVATKFGFSFKKQKYIASELLRQGCKSGSMMIVTYVHATEIIKYRFITSPIYRDIIHFDPF